MHDRRNSSLKIVVSVILFVLLVNAPVLKDLPPVAGVRAISLSVIYPFQFVTFGVINGVKYSISTVMTLRSAQKQNERLREKFMTQSTPQLIHLLTEQGLL